MNIAINGFGRIGRLVFKQLLKTNDANVVAINDLTNVHTLSHLLKYDSSHGQMNLPIGHKKNKLIVGDTEIQTFEERDPSSLPWDELDIDVVLECTGVFRTVEKAALHLKAGAKKVILSAPPKSDGIQTIVLGVNDERISTDQNLYSNASCTTNCLAPQVKLLHETWGIKEAFMTTTHAYTASQRIQDSPHQDLRRARAAAENIIPTTTGAGKATEIVYPQIKGKISAMAIRVPVILGSLTELSFTLESENVRVADINALFLEASKGAYSGIIQFCEDPIVSRDIIGNTHSAIFDSLLTKKQGNLHKIISWYDNETGYSSRLADLCLKILEKSAS